MPVICPTGQAVFCDDLNAGLEWSQLTDEGVAKFGCRPIQGVPDSRMPNLKRPAFGSPAGPNSFDAGHMPVICPTCQIFSKGVGGNGRIPKP